MDENIEDNEGSAADMNEALEEAGFGCYNLKCSFALAVVLIAVIVEPLGYSYVLPAAKCDLDMTDVQRGFIASIPYIGIVITSYPWGYLVDTRGRRKVAVWSSVAAGFFAMLAAFMPDLKSFMACKFLTALCIAGPAAVPYALIGEIVPPSVKDLTLTVINALQITGSSIVPALAWGVLSLEFRMNFGVYDFRPWRLLTILNGVPLIIGGLLISLGPESPTFLLAQGRHDEALKILQNIYAKNKRTIPENFPIKALTATENIQVTTTGGNFFASLKEQSLPLLKSPYHKWLILNSLLLFGVYAALNGLYVWVPDIINRVLRGDAEGGSTCAAIAEKLNKTEYLGKCDDTITTATYIINIVANSSLAAISIVASSSVKIIGKKCFLVVVFALIGVFCSLVTVVKQHILFTIFLSSIPVLGMAIGPINAYSVEIFPPHLRGMAINLSMMLGRLGSVAGANIAGLLIGVHCPSTFYVFGGSLIACSLLSLLLPMKRNPCPGTESSNTE